MKPVKTRFPWLVLFAVGFLLTACATTKTSHQTNVGDSTLVEDALYFGTETPKGGVTANQWDLFLKEVVTPRFPDGLTVWDAKGQWRGKEGVVGKENTKVLLLIHPDNTKADQDLREIIDLYKKKFHQESVMKVRTRPEVSF